MSEAPAAKPRLLVLASTYPRWPGDPEPGFVHELAKRLVHDFDVSVLGPHAPGASRSEVMEGVDVIRYRYAPERFETLVNNGGIVTNLRRHAWKWLLLPSFLLGLLWHAARISRKKHVDVIHAHWLLPQGLAAVLAIALQRKPPALLVTSHGSDVFGLQGRVFQSLKRLVARRAGAVTVVSSAMRDELARIGVAPEQLVLAPMGVDLTERFIPDPEVTRSPAEVLFVGRLVEGKGAIALIRAMAEVRRRRADATLTIVGFGPEEHALKTEVKRSGLGPAVRFVGAVGQAELPAHYRRATVLAAPFDAREGLGLVLVEALACGCPVVATRVPAVRQVFGDWPAHIATPGSVDSLAEQLLAVLDDPGAASSEALRLRAGLVERFDQGRVAAKYSALLADIVRTRVAGEPG